MPTEQDFQVFAGAGGANVLSQADYLALAALGPGFTSGILPSANLNKVLRQASIMSAVLADYIVQASGQPAIDDGTTATLLANLTLGTSGRLLNWQIFTGVGTHTYTPTTGTASVIVEVQAGGGPGCGTPATGAGQTSLGGNGSSGSYAKKRITSAFSGVTITVGAAGVGASGGVGTNGGASSFGTLVSAAGGICGNNVGATSTANYFVPQVSAPAAPTTGDINVVGSVPGNNFVTATMGIIQASAQTLFAGSYGGGGYGFPNPPSTGALTGSNGQQGIVIVWEYS